MQFNVVTAVKRRVTFLQCCSFVVKSDADQVLAVALNFDVFDEPMVEPHVQRLSYIFEFLESIEGPVRY